jgi:hypothetical protein
MAIRGSRLQGERRSAPGREKRERKKRSGEEVER